MNCISCGQAIVYGIDGWDWVHVDPKDPDQPFYCHPDVDGDYFVAEPDDDGDSP
jgi:hypothetical protein